MPPLDGDPTLRLIELIKAGVEVEANSELIYKLHSRGIRNFFLRKSFSAEDARDLTQEVFLRVFRGLGSFRFESRFETWLFEIADHVCQNEMRRRGTGKRRGVEISLDTGGQTGDAEEPEPVEPQPVPPTALRDILEKERAKDLNEAIQELPEQMQACFRLRYGQERSYEEIAAIMGVSINTVKAHLHQAKKRLKLHNI
jgi:RNA polymerase sigma-70 factor (ECF subfamily)